MRPMIFLANWASYRSSGHHGPGRKLSIMSNTPAWARQHARGYVMAFTPRNAAEVARVVAARKSGTLTEADIEAYRRDVTAGFSVLLPGDGHEPGVLAIYDGSFGGMPVDRVRDGDTLLCTCSADEAAASRCHRVWAADFLLRAGWRVILDGLEVT